MSNFSTVTNFHHPFPPSSFSLLPPKKKQKKMSLTQTYFLAHTARAKLSREAARSDHDLRLLVGHANMLDHLMVELADAEREQERWFNQTVRGASATISSSSSAKGQHIQWADTVIHESEEEDEEDEEWDLSSDDDSESDDDDSDFDQDQRFFVGIASSTPPTTTTKSSTVSSSPSSSPSTVPLFADLDYEEVEEIEDIEHDDEEDYDSLALTRTHSRQQPPELLDDSSDDSEEDSLSLPRSPPQATYDHFSGSGSEETEETEPIVSSAAANFYKSAKSSHHEQPPTSSNLPLSESEQSTFLEEGYFLPPRDAQRGVIEAF